MTGEGGITNTDPNPPASAPQDNAEQRPEWLPEKFKTPEDLSKAYSELEKRFSQRSQDPDEGSQNQDTPGPKESEAREAVENSGLDYAAFQDEFMESGELSEQSFEKLEQAGIPREMVEAYIDGQRARAESIRNSVFAEVGGEESYQQVVSWAAQNLSEGEIAAFNTAVNSPDVNQIKLAVNGLYAKFQQSGGVEPRFVSGGTGGGATGGSYSGWGEVRQDMSDPRYQSSPRFREEVAAKLARSNL